MAHDEAHNMSTLLKIPFKGYRQPIEYDREEEL